ncbi:MAG: TIGR03936 family radical SAM-associated protein [Peptococcaceae bacterium]|jgi:radical SAM-linked protein|nr:TIGR03936 family radical SAM-associated protein [Peptococcaceae bacterium]
MKARICYSKTEAGRYLSHLDLARALERGLRRAKVPLAFSEGFNPHPKMSFAAALAVGFTGRREYFDVELRRQADIAWLGQALAAALPPALAFVAAEEVDQRSKSLSAIVNLGVYRLTAVVAAADRERVAAGIRQVLTAGELWRKPKVKPGKKTAAAKEVRGLVRDIRLIAEEPAIADTGAGVGADADVGASADVGTGAGVSADATAAAGADSTLPTAASGAAAGPPGRLRLTLEMGLRLDNSGQLRPDELWEMIVAAGGFPAGEPEDVGRYDLLIEQGGRVFGPMENYDSVI